jgi:hypothetical protein
VRSAAAAETSCWENYNPTTIWEDEGDQATMLGPIVERMGCVIVVLQTMAGGSPVAVAVAVAKTAEVEKGDEEPGESFHPLPLS